MSITSTPTAELPSNPSQSLTAKAVAGSVRNFPTFQFRDQTPRPRRRPFTEDELATIFVSSSYDRWASGPLLFWGPLLGLCMGLRASEVLGLSVEDIVEQDGVTCIVNWERAAVRPEVASVPTRRRQLSTAPWSIPVPQVLVDVGFLDYVAGLNEKQGQQLLPLGQRESAQDTAASLRSKFIQYLRSRGVKEGGFPALRQTFGQRINKAGVDGAHRRRLTRESNHDSIVWKHIYPPLYRMDLLKKSLDMSSPGELPLSHFIGR